MTSSSGVPTLAKADGERLVVSWKIDFMIKTIGSYTSFRNVSAMFVMNLDNWRSDVLYDSAIGIAQLQNQSSSVYRLLLDQDHINLIQNTSIRRSWPLKGLSKADEFLTTSQRRGSHSSRTPWKNCKRETKAGLGDISQRTSGVSHSTVFSRVFFQNIIGRLPSPALKVMSDARPWTTTFSLGPGHPLDLRQARRVLRRWRV
jgi:hypothetical protein